MLGEGKQIKQMIQDMLRNVHTCIPGKISSFDAAKCTAKIQPAGKFKRANGEYLDYPELDHVPVLITQSADQKATVAYPIKAGDGCLLLFAEQQLDSWKDGREPKTELRHALTSAVAIVGLVSAANPVVEDACNDDAIIIDREDSRVIIKKEKVTVLPKKDDPTHKFEVTKDSINGECGKFVKIALTDKSADIKCGEACSIGLSPAKLSLKAPVIEIEGLATMVTSTAFGVNTILYPVSTVPVPGAIPPIDEIPGVSDAIKAAEGAMK